MAQNSLVFSFVGVDRGVSRTVDKIHGKLIGLGKVAAGAAAAGAALFAAHGVRSFLKFDDKMNESLAIMGEVSGPMRERMEKAARAVGTSTRFGADQAAEAYFFLASAGLDAEQSIAALPQVAAFAQAGMFDLATATDLATDAQSALGLSVDDPQRNLANLTRVTDTLVGANTLANASVEQFATSLTQKAGPAMRQAGIDIEQGVAVLAVFADQGIKGERAGTLFAATLEQMQRKAIENKDAFSDLNIEVFDGQGNMRNMADIVADLEGAMAGMSLEQQKATLLQLGFNRSALDGIMALLGSSDAIRDYQGDLEGMAGTTQDVADKQLQSFAARLDIVKSKVTDAAMSLGETLVNAAFDAGETIGEMKRIFEELPRPVQIATGAIAGITVTAPLAIAAYGKVKNAINAVKVAYAAMTRAGKIATLSMGAAGLALAAGAAILGFFAQRNLEAQAEVDAMTDSLDRQTGAVTDNTRELVANRLVQKDLDADAQALGISVDTLARAYLGEADALAAVRGVTDEVAQEKQEEARGRQGVIEVATDEAKAAQRLNIDLENQLGILDQAQGEQRRVADASGEAGEAQDEMAGAVEQATGVIDEQSSATEDATDALKDYQDELRAMTDPVFAVFNALDDVEQAQQDYNDAVKEYGKGSKEARDASIHLMRQLENLEQAAIDGDLSFDDFSARLDKWVERGDLTERQAKGIRDRVKQAREQAEDFTGEYEADVRLDALAAERQIGRLLSGINAIDGRVANASVRVGATGAGISLLRGNRLMAAGGFATRGETVIVGEEGPELVTFARDGHVTPAGETRRLLSGAGGLRGGDPARGGSAPAGQNNYYVTVNMPFGSTKQDVENGLVSTLQSLDRQGRVSLR